METSIEVRYAGVVVGRTSHAREMDQGGNTGLFVGIAEPLPVGTRVTLKMGDAVREARVDEVVEAADPSLVGMRVVFDTNSAASFAPPPPVEPPSADEPPSAAVTAEAEASEAISAPLSLAEPGGGSGKRRRKRR